MNDATLSPEPPRAGALRLAARFARPHAGALTGGALAAVAAGLLVVAGPVLVGRVVDALLGGDRAAAVRLALVALACALVQVLAAGVGRAALARAGERTVRDVRDRVLDQLTTVPLRFVERHRSGDLLHRATVQVASLSRFVHDVVPELVLTVGTLALTLVVLAFASWHLLALLVVTFLPAAGWLLHGFRRAAPAVYAVEADAESRLGAEAAEVVRARPLLAGAAPAARALVADPLAQAGAAAERAQLRSAVLQRRIHAMGLVEAATFGCLAAVGTVLVARDVVSVGVVVTFVLAGRTLCAGFADASALVADVQAALTDLARTADLLQATAPRPVGEPRPRNAPHGALVLDGVTFAYDGGEPVLRGVDLRVEPGRRVVVTGRTGAGKSTLLKVLAGLYAPGSGSATCGSVPVHALTATERVRHVALVPQTVHLVRGSVADELRLVRPDATDEELYRAAQRLGLAGWLAGLAEGLATSTARLSAGERQLVALLRVALLDPAVLVLDEATSDVDLATARHVESAIGAHAARRAVVVVAHRPDTVARWGADGVLELVDGRLVPVEVPAT